MFCLLLDCLLSSITLIRSWSWCSPRLARVPATVLTNQR